MRRLYKGTAGEDIEHLRALIKRKDGKLVHAYHEPNAPIVGHAKGNAKSGHRVTLWHPDPDDFRDAVMRMRPKAAAAYMEGMYKTGQLPRPGEPFGVWLEKVETKMRTIRSGFVK